MTYRVVQWTTGHVARFATRAVLEHPDLELVGCFAHSPDKVGRDVAAVVKMIASAPRFDAAMPSNVSYSIRRNSTRPSSGSHLSGCASGLPSTSSASWLACQKKR